jgi:cytochrome c peroxidase
MHDGRFETLEEVIDHYSEGVQNHDNLSDALKNPSTQTALKMNFSNSEKQDLVNYLLTLTDYEFVQAEKWSDPFK